MNEEILRKGFFEVSKETKNLEGWKYIGDVKLSDDFSYFSSFAQKVDDKDKIIFLDTINDCWIADFSLAIIKTGLNFGVVLVSPECPEIYIFDEELKKDILDPIEESLNPKVFNELNEEVLESILNDFKINPIKIDSSGYLYTSNLSTSSSNAALQNCWTKTNDTNYGTTATYGESVLSGCWLSDGFKINGDDIKC